MNYGVFWAVFFQLISIKDISSPHKLCNKNKFKLCKKKAQLKPFFILANNSLQYLQPPSWQEEYFLQKMVCGQLKLTKDFLKPSVIQHRKIATRHSAMYFGGMLTGQVSLMSCVSYELLYLHNIITICCSCGWL